MLRLLQRRSPLWLLLPLQAAGLLFRLDHLPVWGDELFSLELAAAPLRQVFAALATDIHPPLYYLQLSAVDRLSGGAGIAPLRAVSALWTLLLTALFDTLWLRRLRPAARWTTLTLFALSPFLLLYGRMARSYTMQAALALALVWAYRRWALNPEGERRFARAALAALFATLLLYTHYAPGIALTGGLLVAYIRSTGPQRALGFAAATAVAYAPWLAVLGAALVRWWEARNLSSGYLLTGSAALEQAVKLAYAWVSFSIGESFPAWALALVPVLGVAAALGLRQQWRQDRLLSVCLLLAAAAGYLGVSRWVSYPFMPARLLWLFPFVALLWGRVLSARPLGVAVFAVAVCAYGLSARQYFAGTGFLNPGYSAPLPAIAASVAREAGPDDLVLIDASNTDGLTLQRYFGDRVRTLIVHPGTARQARRRIGAARHVWMVRNTRDLSPGRLTTLIEDEACAGRRRSVRGWHPYAGWQRALMPWIGIREAPAHFYQVTACRAVTGERFTSPPDR